jgi:hypothetical protein
MTKARNLADNALTTVSPTELGYVDGVTSSIQTQLDARITNALVDAKGDLLTATADNVPARLAVGTNGQVLTAASGQATGLQWATPSSTPTHVASSLITANESTSNTSYAALTTAQAVTITTGTKALVILTTFMTTGAQNGGGMSFAVSGASTVAVSENNAVVVRGDGSTTNMAGRYSALTYLTGLTAGSNTFTCLFAAISGTGGSAAFKNRQITVIDMGS